MNDIKDIMGKQIDEIRDTTLDTGYYFEIEITDPIQVGSDSISNLQF